MNPTVVEGPEPYNNFSKASPQRKGSVKRARELLEAGVRPTVSPPAQVVRPSASNISHQTTWPLPASGLQPRPLNPQARSQLQIPRGPLPQRPPVPIDVPSKIPSPSIYSVPSGDESAASIPYAVHPVRSFSLPRPSQLPLRPATGGSSIVSPTSAPDMTPRISIATEDLFRQSTASSTSSAIDLPSIPLPNPQESSGLPTGGIGASPNTRGTQAHRSSVSPIAEELVGSRQTLASIASSRVIPSSWESGLPKSAIVGAYLDDDSGDDEQYRHEPKMEDATLVRNASIGKRGKPTMRTILKSNPSSEVTLDNAPTSTFQSESKEVALTRSSAVGIATMRVSQTSSPARRMSTSTISDESFVDPEKPRFATYDKPVYSSPLEKELEVLPKANPTLSDKRPGARKPPALNLNIVREAEARGSLSSLTDLIRRATRLASNLDHGKTASRADFADIEADFRELGESFVAEYLNFHERVVLIYDRKTRPWLGLSFRYTRLISQSKFIHARNSWLVACLFWTIQPTQCRTSPFERRWSQYRGRPAQVLRNAPEVVYPTLHSTLHHRPPRHSTPGPSGGQIRWE